MTRPKLAAAAALFLVSAAAPALAQDYAFPFWGDDLPSGVRIRTQDHRSGIQGLGKDIGAMRYLGDNEWTDFAEGATNDRSKNDDYLVYGLPFHAMADGEVVACWRNAPENPKPGERHSGRTPPDLRILGGGNHLWIRHDDGSFALYAHAQPGSLPASLCPNSRELTASRVTGLATTPDIHLRP